MTLDYIFSDIQLLNAIICNKQDVRIPGVFIGIDVQLNGFPCSETGHLRNRKAPELYYDSI